MISSGPVLRPASPSTARRLSVPRCYLESPDYSRRCRWSMKPRVLPPLHGAAPRRCRLAVLGTIGHAAANSQDLFSPASCSASILCRDLDGGRSRLAAQGCLPADLRAALLPPGDCQSIPSFPSKYDSSAQAALDMCRMQRSGQTATFSGQVENYAFELCATSPPDTSQLLKRIKMSITARETTMRTTSGDEWSSEGTAGSRFCSG